MNIIQYQIHILIQSKHKFLFNIVLYFIIMLIYNLYLNNTYIECMMRSNSFPSLHADAHITNNDLIYENAHLTEHILALKQEIASLKEQCLTERIENEYTIGILEENQRYLIAEKRALQAKLLETNQTVSILMCDNIDLKEKLTIQNSYNEILRRNLEISEEHNEDLSKALLNITKNKTNET